MLAVMAYTILAALLFIFLTHSNGLRQSNDAEGEGWCPGRLDSVGNVGVRESFTEQAILGWVL